MEMGVAFNGGVVLLSIDTAGAVTAVFNLGGDSANISKHFGFWISPVGVRGI